MSGATANAVAGKIPEGGRGHSPPTVELAIRLAQSACLAIQASASASYFRERFLLSSEFVAQGAEFLDDGRGLVFRDGPAPRKRMPCLSRKLKALALSVPKMRRLSGTMRLLPRVARSSGADPRDRNLPASAFTGRLQG